MSLIVQKFGGSSVADTEKLLHISQITKETRDAGHDVVVVVSAQGNTTDELLKRADSIQPEPPGRERDALLAAGEQMSAALTAMSLQAIGVPAVSLSAWQIPIRTDSFHGDAHILRVGRERISEELGKGRVVVAAGFQGISGENNVTTLGRGGSDYTAVALAAAFHADKCLIYTDVDGVYTADPRDCPTARLLPFVSYEDMYALSRSGAKVLHDKCVALAQARGVEPEVRSCGGLGSGTRIGAAGGERPVVGVTRRESECSSFAGVTLVGAGLPSLTLEKKAILALAAARIAVRGVDTGDRMLTLYVDRERAREALCLIHDAVI